MSRMVRTLSILIFAFLVQSALYADPLDCSASSNGRTIRAESNSDLTADVIITCTGGDPTPFMAQIPQVNFVLTFVGAKPTSRLLSGDVSEALMMVDDPGQPPSNASRLACPDLANGCPQTGNGEGGTYDGIGQHYNIFVAHQTGPNTLTWNAVPFDPAGGPFTRTFRFTNLRTSGLDLGAGNDLHILVSVNGPVIVPLSSFDTVAATSAVSTSMNAQNVVTGANGVSSFDIHLAELANNVWHTRSYATDSTTSPPPDPNPFPGDNYRTETGFYDPDLFTPFSTPLPPSGLPDAGTRFIVTFNNISPLVTLNVPLSIALDNGGSGGGTVRLVSVAADGSGAYSPAATTALANSSGVVQAVYESLVADVELPEQFTIPFTVTYGGGAPNMPGLSGSFNLGALSAVDTSSLTAPIPRFNAPLPIQVGAVNTPPTITTPTLSDGAVDRPYSFQMTATGGGAGQTWSATGLPSGLSISPGGLINGSPKIAATTPVSIAVTDIFNLSDTRMFNLLVRPSPVITTTSLPAGTALQSYNVTVNASGGTPPYTWGAANLPSGLSINNSGVIQGKASSQGTFNITVTVTDSASIQDIHAFSLVMRPPLQITTLNLQNGLTGSSYAANISATGGLAPYSYQFAVAGSQPTGLAISTSGTISGTPKSAGTFNFSVLMTDAANATAIQAYTVVVVDPLTFLTTSPLTTVLAGQPYQTTLFAQGGQAPYSFSLVSGGPLGLKLSDSGVLSGTPAAQGLFMLVVDVRDQSGQTAEQQFQLRINPVPTEIVPGQLDPNQLLMQFTGFVNGDKPPSKSLALVSNSQHSSRYQLTLDGGFAGAPAPKWLTVSISSGTVPARLSVTADQNGLAAGTYIADILISTPDDLTQAPLMIVVNFQVTASTSKLENFPDLVRLSASGAASSGKTTQTITLHNAGGGGPIPFTASILNNSKWITSVTPTTGSTVRDAPLFVSVTVDPTGLNPGQYRDVIRFTPSGIVGGTPVDVPVVLYVAPGGPILDLSVTGFQFHTKAGSGLPTSRQVNIINRGDVGSTIHWSAAKIRGGDWLQLDSTSGSATVGNPGSLTLRLAPSAATQSPGAHYALLQITDAAAGGSPQYLTVVLQVASSDATSGLDLETTGAVFILPPASSGTSFAQQTFVAHVGGSNSAPETLQVSAETNDGNPWLSVTPTTASMSSTQVANLTVTANAAGLPSGIYQGEVVIGHLKEVRSLNVTLIVTSAAPLTLNSPANKDTVEVRSAIEVRDATASCVPAKLAVTQTGMPNHFAVPAGWPSALVVDIHDDCGQAVKSASVSASFSNGDPPLSLLSSGTDGTYSATWQPGAAVPQMNVTIRATSGSLSSASSIIIGDVTQNTVPTLTKNGAVSNLNPVLGGALAPGLVVQIYGTGLSATTGSTNAVPLPTNYQGTSLLMGPYEAPLYYVSPGQLVAQLPIEVAPNKPQSLVAIVNDAITVPEQVDVVSVQPGVVAFSDGRLIVQHSNFDLVTDQNPAHQGEMLVMYLVGLGATNPNVPSGTQSPGVEPLARPVIAPTVTMDGQPVQIAFAGLTPFGVGLFQINFTVPLNARPNVPLDVVVSQRVGQTDVPANATKLTVVPK